MMDATNSELFFYFKKWKEDIFYPKIFYIYQKQKTTSYLTFLDSDFPSSSLSFFPREAATLAKYMITFFVFSVFPAPDSPLFMRKFE
jgi:hypothetical protein